MNALTQRHRAQQLLLGRDTATKVGRLWGTLDFNALDESYPQLAARLSPLVIANHATSSGLAARYVRQTRRAQGASGSPRIRLAEKVDAGQFATSLRVTSVIAVKRSMAAGVAQDVAMANALTQTAAAMSRLVLNGGRETVRRTVLAEGAGWVRVGNGECDWCQQYLDGEVHYVEGYDFDAHDGCGCSAEPVYT